MLELAIRRDDPTNDRPNRTDDRTEYHQERIHEGRLALLDPPPSFSRRVGQFPTRRELFAYLIAPLHRSK
jgi:hypothetical protein